MPCLRVFAELMSYTMNSLTEVQKFRWDHLFVYMDRMVEEMHCKAYISIISIIIFM